MNYKVCANCGAQNVNNKPFCSECGSKLVYDSNAIDTSESKQAASGFDPGLRIEQRAVVAYTGNATSIVIPEGVTAIKDNVFKLYRALESVTLPESLVSIGVCAFVGCTNLTSINLPNKLTEIGDMAFAFCNKLTSFTIPNSVQSIGRSLLLGCRSLKVLEAPTFKNWSFMDYFETSLNGEPESYYYIANDRYLPKSLETVHITKGHVYSEEFYKCDSIKSIKIGAGVFEMRMDLNSSWKNLKAISVDKNNPYFRLVNNCVIYTPKKILVYALPNVGTIPNDGSVSVIAYGAFGCNHNLKVVSIPEGVTEIRNLAFAHCSKLEQVKLPRSLTSIGKSFSGCESLREMFIPASVEFVDPEAFKYCSDLVLYFETKKKTKELKQAAKGIKKCVKKIVWGAKK